MSLLMDALNKAEQAKRQSQAGDGDAAAADKAAAPALALELTPLALPEQPPAEAPAPAAPPPLPELPAHLGILDEEFIAHAAAPKQEAKKKEPPRPVAVEPRPAPKPEPPPAAPVTAKKAEIQDREAAQNLFDAKQPAAPPSRRRMLMVVGAVSVLAGAGIGFYIWLQLQPSGGLGAGAGALRLPSPPAAAVVPPAPAPAAPAAASAAAPAVVPQLPAVPAAAPPRPVAADAEENPRGESSAPIRLSKAKVALNPALLRAYDAYMAGDLATAQTEYQQVLKGEANNLDALHGMAAISLRLGQSENAADYYQRAVEADPRDLLAHAGLINLKGHADPLQSESRLKTLLAAQPDSSAVNFALGNLFAAQARWSEAQAAYFKAYSAEPDNPDMLFNLAVSLDRLHQAKTARHYYGLALAAAANRPAGFDKAQLTARLRELQ